MNGPASDPGSRPTSGAAGPERLPRGRHRLTREQVAADQRARMLAAMAEAMAEKGFVATTVADVIAGAGVSRETFYQQFSSKLDCFLAAFAVAEEVVVAGMADAAAGSGPALDRLERAVTAYLDTLARERAFARLFLVEVHAAGPDALRRRADLQRRVVDELAGLLDLDDDDRVAAALVVAGVGAMVTLPVIEDDAEAIRALRSPILRAVRRLLSP